MLYLLKKNYDIVHGSKKRLILEKNFCSNFGKTRLKERCTPFGFFYFKYERVNDYVPIGKPHEKRGRFLRSSCCTPLSLHVCVSFSYLMSLFS